MELRSEAIDIITTNVFQLTMLSFIAAVAQIFRLLGGVVDVRLTQIQNFSKAINAFSHAQ